jgi:hypothetical protein
MHFEIELVGAGVTTVTLDSRKRYLVVRSSRLAQKDNRSNAYYHHHNIR